MPPVITTPGRREHHVKQAVVNFLRRAYPKVYFMVDMSGANVASSANIASGEKSFKVPDLWIFEPRYTFSGLVIELKKEGTPLFLKTRPNPIRGWWADDHIFEQANSLLGLRDRNFASFFAVGSDEAVKLILSYLVAGQETLFMQRYAAGISPFQSHPS